MGSRKPPLAAQDDFGDDEGKGILRLLMFLVALQELHRDICNPQCERSGGPGGQGVAWHSPRRACGAGSKTQVVSPMAGDGATLQKGPGAGRAELSALRLASDFRDGCQRLVLRSLDQTLVASWRKVSPNGPVAGAPFLTSSSVRFVASSGTR